MFARGWLGRLQGSIQEKIQRVLSDQPKDPEIYGDREMIQLELYIKNGGGNRYNLVRGVAARWVSYGSSQNYESISKLIIYLNSQQRFLLA